MSLRFYVAKEDSLEAVCELFKSVIAGMQRTGLKQWEWGVYPSREILEKDIAQGVLYRITEDGQMIGAFTLSPEQEEEYAKVAWHFGIKPATLHRLALRPDCFGLGLAQRALVYAKEEAGRLGYDSLRLDTSEENARALKLFHAAMTREAGTVYFSDSTVAYHCFESPLTNECALLPIRMHAAYRHGDMTPWGGDALRAVFHKNIPDDRTGEALVISAIPGLESQDDTGVKLPKLMARYGRALVGQDKEFPLLLKLIAAREQLSVQVHPDDAYAREHEGKLGKSEAWVILHAQEGSSILYGMKQGVTTSGLRAALDAGEDIEPMMEAVPVKAGDVFYMPSGMVHAIGGGIVLYEIQQSSDVTYRLWDYGRVNEQGEPRELHIDKAIAVISPKSRGRRETLPPVGEHGLRRLLSAPAFTLNCACVNGELELAPHPDSFRMLTALEGLNLRWEGDEMEMAAGESVLLPVRCPQLMLRGVGRALVAAVR